MPPKLIVYVVHGIGLQNPVRTAELCDALARQAGLALARRGKTFAETDLLVGYADWSAVHQAQARQWLRNNYPNYSDDSAMERPRRSWGLRIFAFLVLAELLFGLCCLLIHRGNPGALQLARLGWLALAAAALPAALVWLAAKLAAQLNLPWGDLWHAARGFEAETLSDVIVYQSEAGRRQIIDKVLQGLRDLLRQAGVELGAGASGIPVLLVGHSLGSVVCYDILLGVAAAARGATKAAGQLAALQARAMANGGGPLSPEDALLQGYLQLVVALQRELRLVGLVTMGSPVSLFVFRKAQQAGNADMWRHAVPAEFSGAAVGRSTLAAGLRWRWLNFWHSSDFVAHKLERLFNTGYPGGKFVEDHRTTLGVADPVSAHASYWVDGAVQRKIGELIADALA